MQIIPSIDIRGGKVVRLYQGDYRRETVYAEDPLQVALGWQEAGAPRIHVVDLDGARAGQPVNLASVEAIARALSVPVQAGGGARSLETAQRLVDAGVQRVVFGTAAVREPELVARVCAVLGSEAVVVGVDARAGMAATHGWTEVTSIPAREMVERLALAGVARFIFTDIATDGTQAGPNVEAVASLLQVKGITVIASGGVGSMADLERLAATGVEGVILGSALYRGAIDLRQAVQRFS